MSDAARSNAWLRIDMRAETGGSAAPDLSGMEQSEITPLFFDEFNSADVGEIVFMIDGVEVSLVADIEQFRSDLWSRPYVTPHHIASAKIDLAYRSTLLSYLRSWKPG